MKKNLFAYLGLKKIIFCLLWASICNEAAAQVNTDTTTLLWKDGYLDIHHINTGRGVATFMMLPDGTTLVVDAGELDDSAGIRSFPLTVTTPYPDNSKTPAEWIADYIRQVYPATKKPVIDYALITHYHGDHMGTISSQTKTARQGGYKLTGITELGELLPIKKLIDRDYPANNFPVKLDRYYRKEPSIFNNLQKFITYQKAKNGLCAEALVVGSAQQITLQHHPTQYPSFSVMGVKRNGTIWTGYSNNTFQYFTPDSVVTEKGTFNENPLSLAIKLTYGKFDYFTGGDNTGLQGYGLPQWFDVETPIAKAVGKVEVTTLNHHGNRDATNENFLRALQPKVVVEQTWCSDHPGQEVMHRLISDHLYNGEKNIFATNIQEATKQTLGFWFTRGYKSLFGHVIIRVLPGGDQYYVFIAETINQKITIKKVFGPYSSG